MPGRMENIINLLTEKGKYHVVSPEPASRNSSRGYCVFSNMGISLLKLKKSGIINSAFVLDFDAHMGDGTLNMLSQGKDVTILNPIAHNNKDYLKLIENNINAIDYVDIVGVCAGFLPGF